MTLKRSIKILFAQMLDHTMPGTGLTEALNLIGQMFWW